MRIETVDLAVLVAYLVAMVLFGLWMGRRQTGSADFMLGGRSMPWWLVLFSIVATETSTVTFLSIPGFAFQNDLTWLQLPLGFALGRLVVTWLLLPRYFKGELFTAYQVLDQRFGGLTKQAASLLFVATRTLADGLRLFLSAIVLREVAGVNLELAVISLGAATILYTFVGGMRAVIWTDFVQFLVYMLGAGIAAWILLGRIDGGLEGFLDTARAFPTDEGPVDKLRIFDFGWDMGNATNFWAGLIGGSVLALATHGVDQLMVQRYLAAKSQGQAGVALVLSGIVVTAQFAFFLLIGVGLAVFYAQQPDAPTFARADRVFATFIVDEMPVGVLGIVLGAVFSAAMSTLSSSLNSSATALSNDVWHPLFRRNAGDGERLWTARIFVIGFGVLQILVGIEGQYLDQSVVSAVLAIASFTTGIVLGVFLLGIAVARAGQLAALIGLVAGTLVVSQIQFDLLTTLLDGADATERHWSNDALVTAVFGRPDGDASSYWVVPAWPWFALIGSTVTVATGSLAALVLPRRTPSTD